MDRGIGLDNYIKLTDYGKHMGIQPGDIIFISSDAKKLLWDAVSSHEQPDLNQFIDGLIQAVGNDGTVIFPVYNWDFCKGVTFDYKTTPSKTGSLGSLALKRADFKRTKHPIYSFAVWGKYQDELCNMENKDAFGMDSPFAFFKKQNVKSYFVDISLLESFTYVHFVEEHSGCVHYRYIKNFTAGYIDEHRRENVRTYSMFVRDLDLDVDISVFSMEPVFMEKGLMSVQYINNSEIKLLRLGDQLYDLLLSEILYNRSRRLCRYKGQ